MTSAAAARPVAGGGSRLIAMLKDAALAAGVALVLAVPLVGFRLSDSSSGAGVAPRLSWVVIGVAAVFVGRLALSGMLALRPPRRRGQSEDGQAGLGRFMHRQLPWLGPVLVALAVGLPFMPFASGYIVDLGITLLIYIMLGWGLNVVVGLAGLLDLGYVAFYAVGAYTFALLSGHFGLGFWECLPIAGLFAAGFGVLLGFPVLRLRGDYLAIVTLGFGEMVRIILLNWRDFTGGPDGISGIPRPTLFGLVFARRAPAGHATFHEMFGLAYDPLQRQIFLYFLVLALALLTNFLTTRLRRLPIGRAWEALREDEIACRALGINPTMAKLSAFGIGASLAGVAGAFFATRQGFVSPESFSFIESAIILAIVVLGGMGSQIGVVCAAAVLVLLPELGREFAQFRMLLFGAAMVLIMGWRPQGLLAHREPSLRLHGRTGR